MKFTMTAMALALATMGMTATPAMAQDEAPAAEPAYPPVELSKKGRKALVEAQTAVNADAENSAELLAAAEAAVETAGDRFTLGQIKLNYAVKRDDTAAMAAAVDEMAGAGVGDRMAVRDLYVNIGGKMFQEDNLTGALASWEKSRAIDPNHPETLRMIAEVHGELGDIPQSMAMYRTAIAAKEADGTLADENWYKRAWSIAYNADHPEVFSMSRNWVEKFPTDANWKQLLAIYHNVGDHSDGVFLDLFRLRRAAGGLDRSADYADYAQLLLVANSPGEALAVLEEGRAAGLITDDSLRHKELMTMATAAEKESGRETLDEDAAAAPGRDTARAAYNIGNSYYGYGEFAKAAEMYAAALTKADVNREVTQLRYGMALARAGQGEAAQAELAKVGGEFAELARYWMLYAKTRS